MKYAIKNDNFGNFAAKSMFLPDFRFVGMLIAIGLVCR